MTGFNNQKSLPAPQAFIVSQETFYCLNVAVPLCPPMMPDVCWYRVVIPMKFSKIVLKQLHSEHLSITRRKIAFLCMGTKKLRFGFSTHTGYTKSSHDPGYIWTLLALLMAVVCCKWLMPIPNGQKLFQCRRQILAQQ